ncbi:hypothetical protein R6Z07M_019741 [Ovis aries]
MGSTASKPDPQYSTPLECLLANLQTLKLKGYIHSKQLTFLCSQAWPQYPLDNGSQWPATGTFDFDVLRDLDNYCWRTGKWSEAPCVQPFWALRSHPTLCTTCTPRQILLIMAPPIPPSWAKPAPPVSESSAFSVPPEDLVAPPPYTSPTSLTPSIPVPPTSPSTLDSPTSAPAPETPPPVPDSPDLSPILYPPLPPITPSPSLVSSHTRSHSNPPEASLPPPPAPLLPLRQVARAEGLAQVHVPFSLQDLVQIEAKLGSFSSNPAQYIKQFIGLTRAYALTWQDIYVILGFTTTPEERQAIWTAAKAQADQRHYANLSPERPPGAQAVPDTDPDWNYQERGGGQLRVRYMIECILDGMETSSHKVLNLLKLDEVTQGSDKNPAMFLNRLTEALVQYTRLSLESPIGAATLANCFISQSAPYIRKKPGKMAFNVYHAREETAEASWKARLKQKAEFQASLLNQQTQALVAALRPAAGSGPQNPTLGACFKFSQEGHWARMCPNPRPPSKLCPLCKRQGHCASDCPQASRALTSRGQGPERPRETSCPPLALELLNFDGD